MEQRSLRLGDIVDDYCPRERRITNHAIVAIVEDAIRQTRCTTCDHEHVFKQGREPRRRKKSEDTLFDQVLADITGAKVVTPAPAVEAPRVPRPVAAAAPVVGPVADDGAPFEAESSPVPSAVESAPAHRILIRATLPKSAGETPPPRPIPEFTMHQRTPTGRGRAHIPARLAFGPQGHPLGPSRDGRPGPRAHANGRNGAPDGNGASAGNGDGAPKNRGRRRRGGKRSR